MSDKIIEKTARAMGRNAAKTIDRIVFLLFYIEKRWIRTNFRSWMKYYE